MLGRRAAPGRRPSRRHERSQHADDARDRQQSSQSVLLLVLAGIGRSSTVSPAGTPACRFIGTLLYPSHSCALMGVKRVFRCSRERSSRGRGGGTSVPTLPSQSAALDVVEFLLGALRGDVVDAMRL